MPPVYLDHASSAALRPAAREAVLQALDAFGDPARHHAEGRRARLILDGARASVADRIGAHPEEVLFTSSGTESVNLAIAGAARAAAPGGGRVVVTSVEHPSVSEAAYRLADRDGFEVAEVPVDETGRADLDRFAAEVARPGTVLASIQHANPDVGTMHGLGEAVRLARMHGVLVHTDACQTAGRLPGGPPGAGALYVRRGLRFEPQLLGDERERRRRAGRENLPAIAGMAAALQEATAEIGNESGRLWALSDRLRSELEGRIPDLQVHGHPTHRVPHIVCWSVLGLDGEEMLMALDERGIRLDTGSRCPGSSEESSFVLEAMGRDPRGSLRASLGKETTEADVDALLDVLPEVVSELRRMAEASAGALDRLKPTKE
ncbi:MAG: cysteine desulfurase [Actinobacteria bacterium]|nr:cysteine desulfurase [Actinomycetota bacterium]